MYKCLARVVCGACIIALGLSCDLYLQAEGASVGQIVANTATASAQALQRTIPKKFIALAALCAVGGMAVKTLWTRYVILRNIDIAINPEPLLYTDQRTHPVSNWLMGTPGFSTPAQIRSHYQEVKEALVTACLSGQLDVFQTGTGLYLTTGRAMYWRDVMSTIDGEISRLRRIMRSLEKYVDVTFKGIHLFGIRKNFVAICDEQGITGLQHLHHSVTVAQEEQIEACMAQDRSLLERICAFFMVNPNYDKAYRLFWNLDQRLGRLHAIKEAIVHSPVNWNIALH
jgi:hypothetical protein